MEHKQAYDVREILTRILDHNDFMEVQPGFAPNIVIGFGRIQGRSIGIVANQPNVLAGALDINASDKAARFIRFLNAFNIPIVTFVDVPGFLPGVQQEYGGIIRHGAKMLFAYSAATGSEDHGGAAQSLRRRLHCDVLEGSGRGSRAGLADGGGCGDGRRRRSRDRLPQGD